MFCEHCRVQGKHICGLMSVQDLSFKHRHPSGPTQELDLALPTDCLLPFTSYSDLLPQEVLEAGAEPEDGAYGVGKQRWQHGVAVWSWRLNLQALRGRIPIESKAVAGLHLLR